MRVAIVGLGLIGGSLARALTARGHEVLGSRRGTRASAGAGGGRHQSGRGHRRGGRGRSRTCWCWRRPPRVNLALLRRLAPLCRAGLVVTDVGSVKSPIEREARRLGLSRFVGGHPIAGSEGSGFGASSATLFRGHAWVLTPSTESAALRMVRRLVREAGARPCLLAAAEHDRTLAFLSHVPQVVSWALFEAAVGDPVARRSLGLAGPGFRDMTRLARSPRPLWRDILGQNKAEVARALRALEKALARARRDLRP